MSDKEGQVHFCGPVVGQVVLEFPLIETSGLVKTFVEARPLRQMLFHPFEKAKRIRALRGVDLTVKSGEVVSLLGPNGAGKTTLLKILSCLVLPDEGSARIAGIDTQDERGVKPKIGLVHSDERSFYWRLSARENLDFFATLYDVPRRTAPARIQELLERVDMADAADRPFSTYSSGMKQRVAIVRALLHDPPVLFMDEPTRSLDPASSMTLRRFIKDELQAKDGKTVLIATHDLNEAEAISDRIAILANGRLLQMGTVQEVRRWGIDRAVFELELGTTKQLPDGPYEILDERAATDGHRRLRVVLSSGRNLDDLLRLLIAAGVPVLACDRVEPDLEEAFTRILGAGDVS